MLTRDIYFQALREIMNACKVSRAISRDLLFIALLGSLREKEEIPGYSDLDVLFIFTSDRYGAIDKNVLMELRKISTAVSKRHKIKMSLLTHTVHEFEAYVDYEYLKHYSRGKVLWGSQRTFSQLFRRVIKKKKKIGTALKRFMLGNILHARFNLVRRFVSFNKFNTEHFQDALLKLFIDNVLEIADWRLIALNIWSESKKEIAHTYRKKIKGDYRDIPYQAYMLRKKWGQKWVRGKDLNNFLYKSLNFIDECVKQLSN